MGKLNASLSEGLAKDTRAEGEHSCLSCAAWMERGEADAERPARVKARADSRASDPGLRGRETA